ncbi:MAG: undecaprenyl/decaprenyl-phosphate alpha-N-acetylglucosaminyl 1-phosphate transferase, partial [Parabacteroides sp.]|nr:undecaprenyl/decaprenyl-phosphate alpha-N-acetylglucosaminyl 1-phosphate transferase [Parabacteroides sp.]
PYTQGAVVIAFSTLLVPALDVVRVVLLRARKGKALFMPDKNHIHHKFLDMGFSPRRAMLAILFLSCALSLYNIIMVHYMNITLLFVTDLAAWIGMHCW